jgi:hypothetical protein
MKTFIFRSFISATAFVSCAFFTVLFPVAAFAQGVIEISATTPAGRQVFNINTPSAEDPKVHLHDFKTIQYVANCAAPLMLSETSTGIHATVERGISDGKPSFYVSLMIRTLVEMVETRGGDCNFQTPSIDTVIFRAHLSEDMPSSTMPSAQQQHESATQSIISVRLSAK